MLVSWRVACEVMEPVLTGVAVCLCEYNVCNIMTRLLQQFSDWRVYFARAPLRPSPPSTYQGPLTPVFTVIYPSHASALL